MNDQRDILITGGTGFVGQHLCRMLGSSGYRITVLTRDVTPHSGMLSDAAHYVTSLDKLDATLSWYGVINLAGEPLNAGRWNPQRKELYRASRIDLTRHTIQWMRELREPPQVVLSASAIGWYGHWRNETLDESSVAHDGYSHQLCKDWELAAAEQLPAETRLCLVRIGIVLGADGGPLPAMLLPARLGLGGPMGNGKQWWSWIHINDLVSLFSFLLEHQTLSGPVNATAPNPVTQREFASLLGAQLRRPAFMPLPSFAAELLLGEFAREVLLNGQRVLPTVAQSAGFSFQFPELAPALQNLLGRQ